MNRFQPRHALVVCVVALLAMGIIMVTSAGLSVDPDVRPTTLLGMLTSRTTIYAGLAILMLIVGSFLDISRLFGVPHEAATPPVCSISASRMNAGARPAILPTDDTNETETPQLWKNPAIYLLLGVAVLLLLVYVPGIGANKNGASRWIEIQLGGSKFSMQPSEVAKWSMTVILPVLALIMGAPRVRRFWTGFLPLLAALALICGLIIKEDLGTAVLIGLVGMIVLWAAGVRWWHIAVLLPMPILAVTSAILTSEYRMERVRAFWNPYADPQGEGYHMIQSMGAISNGGATGRGLGHGVYKFGYLPEDTTDFLFSIVCEEMGIAGAALVLFLYAIVLGSGLLIMQRLASRAGQLIALGIMLTIGIQASINLLVVTGMAPTKGIALPLLSAGGTGWILTAFSLGLLVGLDRANERRFNSAALAKSAAPPPVSHAVDRYDDVEFDEEEDDYAPEVVVLARQGAHGVPTVGEAAGGLSV